MESVILQIQYVMVQVQYVIIPGGRLQPNLPQMCGLKLDGNGSNFGYGGRLTVSSCMGVILEVYLYMGAFPN